MSTPKSHGASRDRSKPQPCCAANKLAAAVPVGSASISSPLVTPSPKFARNLVPLVAATGASCSAKAIAKKATDITPNEAMARLGGGRIMTVILLWDRLIYTGLRME